MKRIKNFVIGGIENKVFNLVFLTIIMIVLVYTLVIYHQSKELAGVIEETSRQQQESVETISAAVMQGVMDNTMNDTAVMQADLADRMFCEIRNDVHMLADYAEVLYADPEAAARVEPAVPATFPEGENLTAWLHAQQTDVTSEEILEEMELIGNMSGMLKSLLDNSEYLGACYIATPSGLTLMCDDAAVIKECAEADYIFDARTRPWYQGAEQKGSLYFTGIERDYYTDRIGIICAIPVYQDGKLAAVVGGDLFLDDMEQAISDSATDSGFQFIVDEKGHVIFSPRTEGILRVVPTAEAVDLRNAGSEDLAAVVKDALNGVRVIRPVALEDKECYMTGAPVKNVGWAVVVATYREAVEKPAEMMKPQQREIRAAAEESYRRGITRSGKMITVLLLLLGILALVNALILARRIVRPLNRMTKRIAVLTGEDPAFEMAEEYKSGDEIEVLAQSFAELSRRTREYIAENTRITAEKERIGAELNVAARIQADMLPRIFPPFPERSEFDLYALMDPAKEVGGDFYDFFMIDEDHLALVMADVSGKGVPAALFMVIAKTLIRNRAQMGGSPAQILSDVNRQLCEHNTSGLFVTVWMAILQISTGKGMAANAGHEHPALRHEGGAFALVEYKHSPPLGLLEEIPVLEHAFELHRGDTLFVYTDGVTEAAQKENQLFGEKRLVDALNSKADTTPEEVLENITERIAEYVGTAAQFDDITMLCLKYYGKE